MQHDYYYAGQMRQAELRQEAEHERLAQEAQQKTSSFYRNRTNWLGRLMMPLGQQLVQFGSRDQNSTVAKSLLHAALPIIGMHALKTKHMQTERKI